MASEQAQDPELGSESGDNAGQASVAGGPASSEPGYGLGYSDLAYYKVLQKGGRVTRHTIRKEEEPAGGNGAGQQTYSKTGRKPDEHAKMPQQREMKKVPRRQQCQKSQATQNQKPAATSSPQTSKDEQAQPLRPKIPPKAAKRAPPSCVSKGKADNAPGVAGTPKDEASNAGEQTPNHPTNAIGDSGGSSGESRQATQKPAASNKKSSMRKLYERKEIGDPINLKMQSMELQGPAQADALMVDEARPSPPKMSKHQSLVVPGASGGEKGAQLSDKLPAAGQNQRSGRQSASKGHPMHTPELLAGQDATTPIEQTE